MKKLGKNEIMAIVESALFLLGAIFMAIVFIVPSNPLWAFIIGLILALIAIGLWLIPPLVNLIKKAVAEKKATTLTAASVEEATATDTTYELHRPVQQDQPTPAAPVTDTTSNPTNTLPNNNQPTTPPSNDQPTPLDVDLDF